MKTRLALLLPALMLVTLLAAWVACDHRDRPASNGASAPEMSGEAVLHDGWAIRSSTGLAADGAAISSAGSDVADWTPATVPATVVAALVAAGV